MRYALINSQTTVVENVIELSDNWPGDESWNVPEGYIVKSSDSASIGDTYNGKTFKAPVAPSA